MKRKWLAPKMAAESFVPDVYVGACITGMIQCAYPGTKKTKGKIVYDDYKGSTDGWWTDEEGHVHGICGYDAPITINGTTGMGYETVNGTIDRNRRIWGVNIPANATAGRTYTVSWQSSDGSLTYNHYGRLVISSIDDSRPNHS